MPTPPTDPRIIDWPNLLKESQATWHDAVESSRDGPRILMATNIAGIAAAAILESTLAVALTLRGAHVDFLVCDGILPGCQLAHLSDKVTVDTIANRQLSSGPCTICNHVGKGNIDSLGLDIYRLGELVPYDELQQARKISEEIPIHEIAGYHHNGLAIGEHAHAGALRFFASGNLENEPQSEIVIRRYFEASLLTTSAVKKLLSTHNYHSACFHHGIYVPQGIVGEVCRDNNVPIANWNPSYRESTFIFSHHDTYHHTLINEPVSEWENVPWTESTESEVVSYLKSRWHGSQDWIWFHEKPDEDFSKFAESIGLDLSKPVIGMLTNVLWDAQLHYPANAFSSLTEWALATFRYFAKRPALQLLVRVHPAEIRGTLPARQKFVDEIQKSMPDLPDNIFIIPPESPISSYAALEICDSALIYGTKMGVELTSIGIPVIVGGEAWIRNKGLTQDASSPEEYFELLDKLPMGQRLDDNTIQQARKYAYHFFFRRMIPLPFMVKEPKQGFRLNVSSIDDLLPGRYPGLDVICDGILKGTPFVYPHENYSS